MQTTAQLALLSSPSHSRFGGARLRRACPAFWRELGGKKIKQNYFSTLTIEDLILACLFTKVSFVFGI
jgi:hypothetical protein